MEYPHIIFIVIDTLRSDYAGIIREELSRLGFVSYDNTISPAPWTVPSHVSMFTGLYPALHGAHETRYKKGFGILPKHGVPLSASLSDAGYTTYLLTANPYIRPSLGFRGFDYFHEIGGWSPKLSLLSYDDVVLLDSIRREVGGGTSGLVKALLFRHPRVLIKGTISKMLSPINPVYLRVASLIRNWPLDKGAKNFVELIKKFGLEASSPIFVFVNLLEVHEPYFPGDTAKEVPHNLMTGRLDRDYVSKWREMYPKEVRYVLKKLEEVLKVLKEKKMFDDSLIIITSDHGQLLGEHGRIGHGTFLYDELLRVPLLIKYPKGLLPEITPSGSDEYVSLVSLRRFILGLIDNSVDSDEILYSETVFAESYGIGGVTVNPKTEEEKKNIAELEKYRVAVYYKNFKGVFNVADWKFEEIKSYDPDIEVTDDIVKRMKKEVVRFLKTATVAKVPRVRL